MQAATVRMERSPPTFCYRFVSVVLAFGLFGLAIFLFLVFGSHKSEPTEYRPGDVFEVTMGPLISPGSIVVWPYYWYPFPRGPGFQNAKQAFWDAVVSLYSNGDCGFRHVAWEDDSPCYAQSTLTNHTEMFYDALELGSFGKAIDDRYRIQPYVDGVRVISTLPGAKGWWWGVDMGYTVGNQVLLYNHLDFYIDVDNAGRVIKAVGVPRHTESIELCGRASEVPNHPVDLVRWSYRTIVQRTDKKRQDMTEIYDNMMNTQETRVGYVMFGIAAMVFVVALGMFVFGVWRICVKNRFDADDVRSLLDNTPITIHREESSEDIEIELYDIGDREDTEVRQRKPRRQIVDIEVDSITRGRGNAKYLLKRFQGQVLGRPAFPRVIAVIVGSAIQLLVVVLVALVITLAYQHAWNNMYQAVTIILLPTTGAIAGFISKWLLMRWNVRVTVCTHFWSIVAITLPLYVVFFIVTSMQMLYHDGAMIAGLFFLLLAFMVLNGIMYGLGVNLAVAFPPSPRPGVRTDLPDPGVSPCRQVMVQSTFCTSVAFAQGFGAVYIGTLLLTTPWNTRIKQQIWFMLLFAILWLSSGAFMAIIATYMNVIYGRYPRWHWPTYTTGALTAVVVFVVSVMYTFGTVTFVDEANNTAVLIYLAVASALVGAVSGAVNWLATYIFFESFIYRRIVVTD